MQIPLNKLKDFHVVPEELIKQAVEEFDAPHYKELLYFGNVFHNANMTPIFMTDENETRWFVTSEETFGKRLH